MAERTILRCLSDVSANVVVEPTEKGSHSGTQNPDLAPDAIIARPVNEEPSAALDDMVVPSPWWCAVEKIASMVILEGLGVENDHILRKELYTLGYSKNTVEKAMDWLHSVILSGQTNATLSMLVPMEESIRIEHPLEQAAVPLTLRANLLKCIRKGLMTRDYAEKIIEGFRNIEARDWSQSEVTTFLYDALNTSLPWLSKPMLEGILCGVASEELFN